MVTLEHPAMQVSSQKSQVPNTETYLFPSNNSNITTTPVTQITNITLVFVFCAVL